MAKPGKRAATLRVFAALYVDGPEGVKGDWDEAAAEAKMSEPPSVAEARPFIEEIGGIAPGLATPEPLAVVPGEAPAQPAAAGMLDAALRQAKRAKTDDQWIKLAKKIKPIALGIADGTVKATAAQAAMVKEIWARAYGKVQEKQSDKRPAAGLLILPALGTGATLTICPQCGTSIASDANERVTDS